MFMGFFMGFFLAFFTAFSHGFWGGWESHVDVFTEVDANSP